MSFSESSIKLAVLFALIATLTTPLFAANGILPGNGTAETPYLIEDLDDLRLAFSNEANSPTYWAVDVHTQLECDLNMSTVSNFPPIGNETYTFKGNFNGNNHIISNLSINRPIGSYLGFFGSIENSTIQNLTLSNIQINGKKYIGGLVGYDHGNSSIINCSTSGSIEPHDNYSGGLCSFINLQSSVINCNSSCNISSTRGYIGGLIGINKGQITDCHTSGNINGHGSIGGLISYNYGNITNSFATGDIQGSSFCGGLIGRNSEGDINQCYSTGNVEGFAFIGGFAGDSSKGKIIDCYSTGNASAEHERIGGFIGSTYICDISNCHSTGQVTTPLSIAGGFIGIANNSGSITSCYSTGSVTGTNFTGGLVGAIKNGVSVYRCYTISPVQSNGEYSGGFFGSCDGKIYNSFWDVNFTGFGDRMEDACGAIGLIHSDFQDGTILFNSGWDFTPFDGTPAIWGISELTGYPEHINSYDKNEDHFENDNSAETATISIPNLYTQYHTLFPTGDEDWITFDVTRLYEIIEITSECQTGNLQMWLYDESMNEIAYNDGSTNSISSITIKLYPGTYFLKIDEKYSNEIIPYSLDLNSLDIILPGKGTLESPYVIEDYMQFEAFADPCNAELYWSPGVYVDLVTDIDLSPSLLDRKIYDKAIIGNRQESEIDPTICFKGHFNGNHHRIKNIVIVNNNFDYGEIGLFSNTQTTSSSPCTIFNLHIQNINITLDHPTQTNTTSCIGGLVGNNNGSIISNCSVTGNIFFTGNSDYTYVGLLSGYNYGQINNSYVQGYINATNSATGGFTGFSQQNENSPQHLMNCYANVDLSDSKTTINNAFNTIVGFSQDVPLSNFWNRDIAGIDYAPNDYSALTTDQMQDHSTFENVGWDFTDTDGTPTIWQMSLVSDFPVLSGSLNYLDSFELDNTPETAKCIDVTDNYIQYRSIYPAGDNDWITFELDKNATIVLNFYSINPYTIIELFDEQFNQIELTESDIHNHYKTHFESGLYYIKVTAFDGEEPTLSSYHLDVHTIPYSGGEGTENTPYLIGYLSDLVEMHNNPSTIYNQHFKLIRDIDCLGYTASSALICQDLDPYDIEYNGHPFIGSFDGQNYTISNLKFESLSSDYDNKYLALFGNIVEGGEVKNLHLRNFEINTANQNSIIATLASCNRGTVIDCSSTGVISANNHSEYIGGLIGIHNGVIDKCYTNVNINASTDSLYAGGIAGLSGGNIYNSYATGDITAGQYTGGLIGYLVDYNSGYNIYCYSSGKIIGDKYTNGFCGFMQSGSINYSFWDIESSGIGDLGNSNFGAIAKNTSQMHDINTFRSWPFIEFHRSDLIWHMPYNGTGYPMLYYQRDIPGDLTGQYGVDMDDFAALTGDWQIENMSTLLDIATHWLAGM